MPPKRAAAKKKNAKPVFDPFERVCAYTSIPLHDPFAATRGGDDPLRHPTAAAGTGAPPPPLTSASNGEENNGGTGDGGKAAEFTASELTIVPPLPRTEVALTLRCRVTVALTEGDVIYVHLPKFNGPPAQQFGLQSTSAIADVRNSGGEVINTATYFRAFWSGTTPKVTSAVHMVEFKRGKKDGAPPKQVLLLQCLRDVAANALLVFSVPRALGIVSPDKLPANSSKLKLEGPQIYMAEGHRIPKQIILASSEIRKQTVVEELGMYDHCIAQVTRDCGLQADDRQLCEQLSVEEIDQLWQAAQYRCRFPVPMAWTVAQEISVTYEEAGGFVKRIVQNAITAVKHFDPLAVHKEVARNWGVKAAAVVMLDDFLSAQWGGLYPGIPRISLFAACLLKMEPVDVGRAFVEVQQLPRRTIIEDLMSAFRMRATLDAPSTAAAADSVAALSTASVAGEGGDKAETEALMAEILAKGGSASRCAAVLDKWAALLTALLPASLVVGSGADEQHSSSSAEDGTVYNSPNEGPPRADAHAAAEDDDASHFSAAGARARPASHRRSTGGTMAMNSRVGGGGAVAVLRQPPTLYLGFRDVPAETQRSLRELQCGEWFVLPFLAVARQSLPYVAVTPSSLAAAAARTSTTQNGNGDHAALHTGLGEGEETAGDDGDAALAFIPENAVVVELRHVVEALELADIILSPYNGGWLLPLATSCRVVAVEEDQHEVLHIVVDMVGSLVGQVSDSYLPQSDRGVATVILSKYLSKTEQTDFYVSSFSLLAALYARRNERRRLHPPTLIRAKYLSHYNAAKRASAAKYNVEETERVEWQVRTHDAVLLDEGVVKPAVWEPIQMKYMLTVEQFFLGHSRTLQKLEEGTLSVDLEAFTIDYGGKGPRALRRVVEKLYVTHEALPKETLAILTEREEHYTSQLMTLDNKLGISPRPTAATTAGGDAGKNGSTKGESAKASKKKTG
jgi:hypothetical protein